jgi:hypothetical protein
MLAPQTQNGPALDGDGSIEYLDHMLFWTAADLERKLVEFQQYYNEHRTHAGRAGCAGADPECG